MSLLVFGACSRARIGVTASQHLVLSSGYGSAFQTISLSAPTRSAAAYRSDSARSYATAAQFRRWKTTRAKQLLSASAIGAGPWTSSSPAANFLARTTRAIATESGDFRNGKPTLAYAQKMPKTFAAMTNDQVLHFAELEIPEACHECVVRDIMVVDQVEHDEAMETFDKVAATNREGMRPAALPFYLGFGVAFTGAIVSIPMVFHLPTVEWFNEAYVTSDLPPPRDLETWLEVGAASWNWMEPVLGHISFFLLCMQFSRAQLHNLGIRPYFNWQRERRANYLINSYPQYDAEFLGNYSRCDKLVRSHPMSQ